MRSARSRPERERGAMSTTKRPFTCEGHHIGGVTAAKRRRICKQTPRVNMNVTIYECMGMIFVARDTIETALGQRVVELCDSDGKDDRHASAFSVSRVVKCCAEMLVKNDGDFQERYRTGTLTGICALYAAVQSAADGSVSASGPYVDAMAELGKFMTNSAN